MMMSDNPQADGPRHWGDDDFVTGEMRTHEFERDDAAVIESMVSGLGEPVEAFDDEMGYGVRVGDVTGLNAELRPIDGVYHLLGANGDSDLLGSSEFTQFGSIDELVMAALDFLTAPECPDCGGDLSDPLRAHFGMCPRA